MRREVAAQGSVSTRLRLANELDRRALRDEAVQVLFDALAANPESPDLRLALGKFRGPAPGPWGAPQADGRNTRRSSARGPRGEGRVLSREKLAPPESALFTPTQDERVTLPDPLPPPLVVGKAVHATLHNRKILALTADGHAIAENFGAGGFLWSAERDGKRLWQFSFPHGGDAMAWSRPHAAVAPDATVYGVTSLKRLVAIEPDGSRRYEHELPAKVASFAFDADRQLLHLGYQTPPVLSIRDARTGLERAHVALLEQKVPSVDEVIVCDDGLVACVSAFKAVCIVAPDGAPQRVLTFAERIGGVGAALSPRGELITVSYDPRGAYVQVFDPATGARKGGFEALDCVGAHPAVDAEGTIYLDGGARGYVLGFDLISGQPRYRVDRASLWRTPDHPPTALALAEGEVLFVEIAQDGVELVRVG